MTSTEITRSMFQDAIEAGIAKVDAKALDGTGTPRTWRAKLRKVGREAVTSARLDFSNCPLTQADLNLPGMCGACWPLMQFAFGFDDYLRYEQGVLTAALVIV